MSKVKYQIDIDSYIGPWAYSKHYVKSKLKDSKGSHVDVRLNSLGGSLDHGLDIMNQFKEHGDVTVHLYGFNASASTIASLGAKKVVMDVNGFYLIHKVSNWVDIWGQLNSDQINAAIQSLKKNKIENDKIDTVMVAIYSAKTGLEEDELKELMSEDTWITAQEALDYGFVDELINTDEKEEKFNFTPAMAEKLNAFGLPPFPTTPQRTTPSASENENWIDKVAGKLYNKVRSAFSTEEKNTVEQPKPVIMDKTEFAKLNGVLGVESITLTDGKANLSEEQLDKLNQALADGAEAKENLDKEKEELTNQVTELTAKIEALKEKPADDTPPVDPAEDKSNKAKTNLSGADLLAELPNL